MIRTMLIILIAATTFYFGIDGIKGLAEVAQNRAQ
ncbi:hypothetical protein EDB39_10822 [Vibrio crassostreae]|nr:hypothetical protein EDB52_107208 [Vibrio crassostreae]TCT40599.1 hypothetical protein EDB29_104213 [Vibrio crassostreae]TCT47839.1 hypothetical protein EDB39_10822 [Vibrio crassostreae]TCT57117.1 hypothetical protein EDB40_10922 [Vibrio crassostreae]